MKAAIYGRVSTSKQEQEQTIESQLERLRGYIEKEGLEIDEKNIYIDDGYSGTKLERPGLDALRDGAAEGRFQKIVIYSPDRLARRYAYQVIVIEELNKCGCEVIFLQKPLSDDPEENLLIQMQGIIAEYERAKIIERTRRGRLFKARQGHFLMWSTPPYGYRYQPISSGQPGCAIIQEEEAELVKQIFQWYVEESVSTYKIAKRLNLMGIHPRKGGKGWAPATIRLILVNETYIGKAYYKCRKGRDLVETHRETKCKSRAVRQKLLDEVVWQKITELLENPELIIEQYKRQKDIALSCGIQKQCQKLEQQTQLYDKQIQRLIDAYQMEIITLKELETRKGSIEQKILQLQEQIRDIKAAEKKEIDYRKIFDNIEAFCSAVKQGIENASFEDKRKIIELLIEEVVVTNGKVEIVHIIPLEKKGNLQLHGRIGI